VVATKEDMRLKVGTKLPPLDVVDVEGKRVQLSDWQQPTILYVFSPTCGWCERNATSIGVFAREVAKKVRVMGIALSAEYPYEKLKQNPLPFPVYAAPSPQTVNAYRFGGTPETISVNTRGEVQQVWFGAYMGVIRSDLERLFSVSLPQMEDKTQRN
jgi:peroxiredoxin